MIRSAAIACRRPLCRLASLPTILASLRPHGHSDMTCRLSTHGCLGTTGGPYLASRLAPGIPRRLSTCACPETGPSAAVWAQRGHPGPIRHRPARARPAIVPPVNVPVLFAIVSPAVVPLHSSGRPVSRSARCWFRPSLVSLPLCQAQLSSAPEDAGARGGRQPWPWLPSHSSVAPTATARLAMARAARRR